MGKPDVGRLGEGTLAPDTFRMFGGFGGVKAKRKQHSKDSKVNECDNLSVKSANPINSIAYST